MDMKKLKIKQEADEDNHFARIPDDLLLLILSRMDDLKFLCQCSLVSRRFALTIYHMKTVSLILPSTERSSIESVEDIDKLFHKLPGFTSEEITRFIQSSSLKALKFFLFLKNFRELKSISLEFTCPRCLCSSSLFNMKVKFSSGRAMVDKLVSIVATSVHKDTEQGYDEEQDQLYIHRNSISGSHLPFGCCTEWLIVLCLLIKCQPSLESVIITNSKKQGTLVLRGQQLVAWRNTLRPGGLLHNLTPGTTRIGWLLELHMPISGYLMKGVYFVIGESGFPSIPSLNTVYDDALTWEYMGEEKLIDEAVSEILAR